MKLSLARFVLPALLPMRLIGGNVGTITATPSTVVITSTNPATPVSSSVTLTWLQSGGDNNKTWNVTVYANQSTLASCPAISTSAISVQCTSASNTGNGTGSCSGSFPLSTTPTQVVGGKQASGSANFTVHITYQFGSDSWTYIGNTCSLTLTYVVTQN